MLDFSRSVVLYFVVSLLFFSQQSLANNTNIGQRLLAITSMENKEFALEEIDKLYTDIELTTLEKLSILQAQGEIYHQQGKLTLAINSAKTEQSLAKRYNLKQPEADAYKRLGVYSYYKGDNLSAIDAYQNALNYYLSISAPIPQANLFNNIALVHAAMGQLDEALYNYQQAEPLYQLFGDQEDKIDIQDNVAGLHLRAKRYDMAIAIYLNVIEQRTLLGDKKGLAMTYGDIGSSYKYAGDYQKANQYMNTALTYYRQVSDDYNAASILHNLAELNNYLNNIEQAIAFAQEGIRLSVQQGHDNAYVGSLYSLAKAYFHQGQLDLALVHINKSSEVAKKMHYKEQLKHNLSLLALIYAAKNDPVKAIESHQSFLQAHIELSNDSLNTKLALFDSEQLKQQVAQLTQQKKLQALEMEQSDQERNFIIIVVFAALLIGFLIARRDIEKRSTQALESKVKQRTNELEYLMQELQNANKIKSQFLANMSHEIRTPLTTVIGQAEAIINGDVEQKYITKEVGIIHGNSLHLLELTNNILDLSKIEANKIELDIQSQDLHGILLELANMFTLQAHSKGLTFEIVHALPMPFFIEIDGFRIKQILINLCSNAIKFTPKGHVELKISQAENQLLFKITDSGIGMSSSQLQHLFESFTQGDSSISRRFGGTGLGLCLSEQLAKIMGGAIDVESELNQGSVFAFTLPCLHNDGVLVHETKVDTAPAVAIKNTEQLQGTVLLAEDHDDNRRLIARLLATLGLDVVTARNGGEAVALTAQHQPRLILMDIQMPEMDGIEAFKVLRQQGCQVPIIALTANAMSHEIEHYLTLGFNGHLSKPIAREIFIPTIAKYCDGDVSQTMAEEKFSSLDMSDLVLEFKSNLVLEQQDLVLHINNNQLDKLAQLAHRIAGAAQMFGFVDLSTKALKLEMMIKNENNLTIRGCAQELLNEIDQVLW